MGLSRPGARQQFDFALPAHDDHHGKSVGHYWQCWRRSRLGRTVWSRSCWLSSSPPTPRLLSCSTQFLRLQQVAGRDILDEVKCGRVTLHMQDDTFRYHLVQPRERAGHVLQGRRGGAGHRQRGRFSERREMTLRRWQRRTRSSSASTARREVTSKAIAETTNVA